MRHDEPRLVCGNREVSQVCVYYCSTYCMCVFCYCRTYYKAVRVWGGRIVEDMCYERRRAEACVD